MTVRGECSAEAKALASIVRSDVEGGIPSEEFPQKHKKLDKLLRIYGYVFAAVARWRKKVYAKKDVLINCQLEKGFKGSPSRECLRAAELYLLEKAQTSQEVKGKKLLNVKEIEETDVLGISRKIEVIGSRASGCIEKIYGADYLPVLPREHPLSQMYMEQAHQIGHEGIVSTLHRCRSKVWVTAGRHLGEKVKRECLECRIREKRCAGQAMGPLPEYRAGPARVFDFVAVDLFGPLEFQGTVNKRQTNKGWGVIFVCSASLAVHIEFTDSYSTNGFLLALQRFMCAHGTPSRIQSDRGEQLVAASKQIQG